MTATEDTLSGTGGDAGTFAQAGELVENFGVQADAQFLDDLGAVSRFKTFLLSRGRPVGPEVSEGVAKLMTTFLPDLKRHELLVRDRELWRNKLWFWQKPSTEE
jgi:hypothetical protein